MKKTLSLLVVLAACAAYALTPEERAAQKAATDAWRQLKKDADALVKRDFTGGFANYWHDSIDAARELYETAFTNAVMRNAEKIDACREIAKCHLEATRDVKAALAALERAFALDGLTDADRAHAEKNRHEMKVMMLLEPKAPEEAERSRPRTEEALRADLANVDPRRGPDVRGLARYGELVAQRGFDAFKADFVGRVLQLEEAYPKSHCRKAGWTFASGAKDGATVRDARYPALLAELAASAPEGGGPDPFWMFRFLAERPGFAEEAARYATACVASEKDVRPGDRAAEGRIAEAKKFLAFKDVGESPRRAIRACRDYLEGLGRKDDAVELALLLSERAQAFLRAGNEPAAREVWDERCKIAPPRETSRLDCFWWKDAPHDIRGILQSETYKKAKKGLLVHRYGDNLKFLIETDAAILGREMTTDRGEAFRPGELVAFCDAEGVKIFLYSFQDDMAAVRDGLSRAPGYEIYLATGVDDPYHCIMLDPAEGGKTDVGFVTQYDNGTGYRNLKEDGGAFRSECLYLDDGVATLISVPWSQTFASLPSRSPVWYLEAISWAHGGRSFGGSLSVHHRSSFGELVFAGVDEAALKAIKRRLLPSVKARFDRSTHARSAGFAEKWADPELGDQAFYLAEVKPFVERLGAEVGKIAPGLDDDEAAGIYDRVGEDVLNMDFVLSRKRTDWLTRKLTDPEEVR